MSIFAMLGEDIKTAGEYQQAFLRFKQMNMGEAVNKEADTFARSTEVFNTSAAGLMDTLTDLREVCRSQGAVGGRVKRDQHHTSFTLSNHMHSIVNV